MEPNFGGIKFSQINNLKQFAEPVFADGRSCSSEHSVKKIHMFKFCSWRPKLENCETYVPQKFCATGIYMCGFT